MGVKSHQKRSTWLIILLMVLTTSTIQINCTATEAATVLAIEPDEELAKVSEIKPDLEQAETTDGQKEILKQIRRLNDDGSYTVGYEAEDGTFKFESRDVLGNIKGTYGYVDENGEIKRVTYTGKNESSIKNSAEDSTAVPTIHATTNRTFHASTTRRPTSLAYLTSTPPSPTRSSVIQPIPRKRIIVPYPERSHPNTFYANSKQSESSDDKITSPTVIYATSVPSAKPAIVIRPTPLPQSATRSQEQVPRPEKLEGDPPNANIRVSTNRETSTSKPAPESANDRDQDRKPSRGNHLRRQLGQQERNPSDRERDERFSTQQQIIYSQSVGEEGGHIYGGSVTARPIFSTTHSPRTPGIVLAARHRAAQIQNSINSNSQTTTTTEKVYVKPPRRPDTTENNYEQTTEPSSENSYHTQTAGPIVQIPPNREVQAAADDDPVVYRRRPIPPPNFEQQFRQREYPRQYIPPTTQRGLYRIPQQTPRPDREQFLRETTQNPNELAQSQYSDENLVIAPHLQQFRGQSQRPRANYVRPFSDQQETQVQGNGQDGGYEQQSYQVPFAQNPYRPSLTSQPFGGYPDRPLTTRDFERLLQLLILKNQQLQQARLGYFGPTNQYLGAGYTQAPFGGYQQIPRPPIYDPAFYDPRNPYYRAPSLLGRYSEQENVYQAQNHIQDQTLPYDGQRLIPRKKQYNPRYFGAASYPDQEYSQQQNILDQQQPNEQDYLPPNVREDLLYRMLMLAIQSEQNSGYGPVPLAAPSNLEPATTLTTTTTRSTPYNRKPVRSVEILGEDN